MKGLKFKILAVVGGVMLSGVAFADQPSVETDAPVTQAAPLSSLPMQGQAMQWVASVHVPEFLGTATAFAVMGWALRSRRIV